MIEAYGVGKLYQTGTGTVGLHELDLNVQPGRVVALLGHNGAGKTTTVRGLTTLLRFDRGHARVAGFDVATQARRVRERIALVGQSVAVDDQLSASQNLVLFARLRGLDRPAALTRARELLTQFGLDDAANRPVHGFSGGMRRRLDLAASMIIRPEVLFVDEPTAGLDPAARRDLWDVMRTLVSEGTTVLLTTQYLEEADALADHIVLLAGGRVIAEGTADALKDLLGPATIRVRLADPGEADRARWALATFDPEVRTHEATVTLPATRPDSLLHCIRTLTDLGLSPVEVTLRKPSLDEGFLSLTEHHDNSQESA